MAPASARSISGMRVLLFDWKNKTKTTEKKKEIWGERRDVEVRNARWCRHVQKRKEQIIQKKKAQIDKCKNTQTRGTGFEIASSSSRWVFCLRCYEPAVWFCVCGTTTQSPRAHMCSLHTTDTHTYRTQRSAYQRNRGQRDSRTCKQRTNNRSIASTTKQNKQQQTHVHVSTRPASLACNRTKKCTSHFTPIFIPLPLPDFTVWAGVKLRCDCTALWGAFMRRPRERLDYAVCLLLQILQVLQVLQGLQVCRCLWCLWGCCGSAGTSWRDGALVYRHAHTRAHTRHIQQTHQCINYTDS